MSVNDFLILIPALQTIQSIAVHSFLIFAIAKVAAALTGAGIGVGVAYKYKASQLVVVSAAVAGLIGAFAPKLIAGTVFVDGKEYIVLSIEDDAFDIYLNKDTYILRSNYLTNNIYYNEIRLIFK